jgi:hypothetical protein
MFRIVFLRFVRPSQAKKPAEMICHKAGMPQSVFCFISFPCGAIRLPSHICGLLANLPPDGSGAVTRVTFFVLSFSDNPFAGKNNNKKKGWT